MFEVITTIHKDKGKRICVAELESGVVKITYSSSKSAADLPNTE